MTNSKDKTYDGAETVEVFKITLHTGAAPLVTTCKEFEKRNFNDDLKNLNVGETCTIKKLRMPVEVLDQMPDWPGP